MSGDQVVTVSKAEPNHSGHEVPGRSITITAPMPAFGSEYVADARAFHLRQAELIHGALIASLPGGTLDQLFAVMAADRASILRVPRPAAVAPAPAVDGDVVDAEIDFSEAYTELAEMRLAVLAIHKRAEWGACCDWCHYDDRDVPWPCPTAQALGVKA